MNLALIYPTQATSILTQLRDGDLSQEPNPQPETYRFCLVFAAVLVLHSLQNTIDRCLQGAYTNMRCAIALLVEVCGVLWWYTLRKSDKQREILASLCFLR